MVTLALFFVFWMAEKETEKMTSDYFFNVESDNYFFSYSDQSIFNDYYRKKVHHKKPGGWLRISHFGDSLIFFEKSKGKMGEAHNFFWNKPKAITKAKERKVSHWAPAPSVLESILQTTTMNSRSVVSSLFLLLIVLLIFGGAHGVIRQRGRSPATDVEAGTFSQEEVVVEEEEYLLFTGRWDVVAIWEGRGQIKTKTDWNG